MKTQGDRFSLDDIEMDQETKSLVVEFLNDNPEILRDLMRGPGCDSAAKAFDRYGEAFSNFSSQIGVISFYQIYSKLRDGRVN